MAPTTRSMSECPVCTKTITTNEAKTACLACKTYFHDACVLSVGLMASDVLRMKQTTSTFHFICKTCKANIGHVATVGELELRARLMKLENETAVQIHAANAMADELEKERMTLKKQVQDLTRKVEVASTSTDNSATITRNRELAAENKKLNNNSLANYEKMEQEMANLQEITEKIPEFRAQYDQVVAERSERDTQLARFAAYIKDLEGKSTEKDNVIKELRETQNRVHPQPSTSQNKRRHTDLHQNDTDLVTSDGVEQHINTAIGNRFQKLEDSQRLMADALDQIRAALVTNMPTVNFAQFPKLQKANTPAQGARARSTSRKTIVQPVNKPINMSYAAALTKSTIRPDVIRNINIMGTPEEVKTIIQDLREGTHISGAGIASVKPKGKTNITLTFNNADEAQKTEDLLNDIYRNKLVVKKVQSNSPQIKITRLFTKLENTADIVNQIKDQNHWLRNATFEVAREYSVETLNGTYRNLIINCDLILQKEFMRREAIIFGINECRCFEYVDVLRCNKCLRYGHFARECTFLPTCKRCTEHHETGECVAAHVVDKCANCILSNKRGTNYPIKHRTTDERCPVRTERVEALKKYHLNEKPKN